MESEGSAFLGGEEDQQATRSLRRSESTGRPAGSAEWIAELEKTTGRKPAAEEAGAEAQGRTSRQRRG